MSGLKTFTTDPTCGMTVDEATAVHAEQDGKTYSFCSDPCRKTFLAISAGEATSCGG